MFKVRSSSQAKESQSLVDTTPGCPFGVLVEERLKNVERHIQEVKGRINGLIFVLIGAVVVEVVVRLLG